MALVQDELRVHAEGNVLRVGHEPNPERTKLDTEETGTFHRAERVRQHSTAQHSTVEPPSLLLLLPSRCSLQSEVPAWQAEGLPHSPASMWISLAASRAPPALHGCTHDSSLSPGD